MNKLITVIIANYNHGEYAKRAINSVLAQDYQNKQIIVIDDASTDNSLQSICDYFHVDVPKKGDVSYKDNLFIKALEHNKGRAGARNEGFKLFPDSPLYGILDADDEYLPGKISKSVAQIDIDPKIIGVVYTDYISYNHLTKIGIKEFRPPFDIISMHATCQINNDSIINGDAIRMIGMYDEQMEVAEDYDLWLRLTSRFAAIHIPEFLLQVGVTGFNATTSISPDIWRKNWARISEKMQTGMY